MNDHPPTEPTTANMLDLTNRITHLEAELTQTRAAIQGAKAALAIPPHP